VSLAPAGDGVGLDVGPARRDGPGGTGPSRSQRSEKHGNRSGTSERRDGDPRRPAAATHAARLGERVACEWRPCRCPRPRSPPPPSAPTSWIPRARPGACPPDPPPGARMIDPLRPPSFARIAVFGGVYSNPLALAAALADVRSRGVEAVFCLGDLGAFGPHPD